MTTSFLFQITINVNDLHGGYIKSKKNYKQVANCLYEATEYKVNRVETSSVDFQGRIYKEIMVGISHDNTTPR